MKVNNILASNMETADGEKAALDAVCKKLIANKSILAWILKTCVEEYGNCSLKDIEGKYIEGMPVISHDAVHQDETAASGGLVKGIHSGDASMTEGTVTYDIRFTALHPLRKRRPNNRKPTSMIINIEGQTNFYPGYPLPKRGIYYGSRMISSQYGTVFSKSHYEKLEKVYSIWVCINPPKYRKNSINLYSFHEERMLGNVVERKENYDLITVVMICLGDENDKNGKGLIRLLSVLLSTDKSASEKKKILEEEFGIAMTETMEKEADEMCDFGNYVEEKGIRKGIEQGRKDGIIESLKNLIKNANMTLEQAMAVLEIPEADRPMYAGRLES